MTSPHPHPHPRSWSDFIKLDHGTFMTWLKENLGRKISIYQAALEALGAHQAQGLYFEDIVTKEAFNDMALSLSNSKPFVVQFTLLVENTLSEVPWKLSGTSQTPPPQQQPSQSLPPQKPIPNDLSPQLEIRSSNIEPQNPSSTEILRSIPPIGEPINPSLSKSRPLSTQPIEQPKYPSSSYLRQLPSIPPVKGSKNPRLSAIIPPSIPPMKGSKTTPSTRNIHEFFIQQSNSKGWVKPVSHAQGKVLKFLSFFFIFNFPLDH
jgi:hypothetical protein